MDNEQTSGTLIRPRLNASIGPGTRLLNGKFELVQILGQGGMGVVYQAIDREAAQLGDPNSQIALKVLSESIQSLPEARLALQRESSRARRLAHPNIVRVFEFYDDRGVCFITMELLQGESWDDLLREHSQGVDLKTARPMIEQLCAALTYAHQEGVVHSDLKPRNLFITPTGTVKVLDFGIAAPMQRAATAGRETLYNPRRMEALSPSHACLEMWQGLEPDPRDDVYSVACIVYELLSGAHPFSGASAVEALDKRLSPAPIASLSSAQNLALRQALALARRDRIPSVAQFAEVFFRPGANTRGLTRRVLLAAIIAGFSIAAVLLTQYALRQSSKQQIGTPVTGTERKPGGISGRSARALADYLGMSRAQFRDDGMYSPEQVLAALQTSPRRAELGSTGQQLDAALALCRTVQPNCNPQWYADERVHVAELSPFSLDPTPTTVAAFREFVVATQFVTDAERTGEAYTFAEGRLRRIAGGSWRNAVADGAPDQATAVVGVTFNDSLAFCQWRGMRLPTEDEWEYIARGPERHVFAWGDDPGPAQVRWSERPLGSAGMPQGIGGDYRGLSGNVWQWTTTDVGGNKVLKGGSWLDPNPANRRAAAHRYDIPLRADSDTGFRCAKSVSAWPDAPFWLKQQVDHKGGAL